ncbi:MAG: hypothetical protein KDD50_12600 [Bdellovibrionales bacterium]|nr:hypothetical protein [Bdellovibrionales bacterium]
MNKPILFLGIASVLLQSFTSYAQQEAQPHRQSFNPAFHFSRTDSTSGLNIGADLYQQKANELADIIVSKEGDGEAVEQAVIQRNLDLIKKMEAAEIPSAPSGRVGALTKKQRVETLKSIKASPAYDAQPVLKEKYDPNGSFGFCFGRAYYYANESGLRGLVKESIKKVFLIGKMTVHTPLFKIPIPVGTWQFHVATAVRGTDGKWYAIDNHFDRSLKKVPTVEEWYDYYRRYLDSKVEYEINLADGGVARSNTRALFLYFTDPDKIGANSNAYNEEGFYGTDINGDGVIEPKKEAYYNNFFIDLDLHFDKMIKNLSRCSPIRYNPSPAHSSFCQRPEEIQKIKDWTRYTDELEAAAERAELEERLRVLSPDGNS